MTVVQRIKNIVTRRAPSPQFGAFVAALLIFLLLLPAWILASQWYQARLLTERRSQAADELALRASTLSGALNRRFSILDGLDAFSQVVIQDENFGKNFETFAASVYENTTGIRTIAVAPGGVVYYVYPIEDNVRVVGYDPLKDTRPGVREDVERAIDTRQVVLSGPTELSDGKVGVVARKAVYQNDRYWGLINLVVDLEPVLALSGINEQETTLDLVLRDQMGQTFFGNPDINSADPVRQQITLQDGNWELAGVPSGGWLAAIRNDMLLFQVGLLTIFVLIASLVYLTVNRQSQLTVAVGQRTQELTDVNDALQQDIAERKKAEEALKERETQYRSIFESVNDGLLINDLDGNLVDFNPAAAAMHGYTVEEFRKLQPKDFIHLYSLNIFRDYIETVKSGGQFRDRATNVKKDGIPFLVEITGTQFNYYGVPHTLAAMRDITEQVQAYQLLERRVTERTREISALLELARNVASTLELKPLLALVLSQLKTVVDYTGAAIATIEDGRLEFLDYQGPSKREQILSLRVPLELPTGYQEVIRRRRPVIFNDPADGSNSVEELRDHSLELLEQSFGYASSWLGVPLMVKDRIIGVLRVDHLEREHFNEQDAQLVLAFANQAAVAIDNARLYERAQNLAALEERQRLARELHDSVSQALYGIALGVRTARGLADRSDTGKGDLTGPLDYILSLADAALVEMRALIFELRPETLQSEGLIAALNKQAEALRARHQIEVQTEFYEEPAIAINAKETLYRVAQEAIHNTTKHASASRVTLKLVRQDGTLALEIADNGKGFDPSQEFPGHLGLRSMRERIESLGGELTIDSQLDQGTRVLAVIPINTVE
jgi:PAS domain S-box-containing protein